jgi:hypothetical protein
MRCAKISVTKSNVRLVRETTDENGATESIELESPERPLPSFVDALQAFKGYVNDLLPFDLGDDRLTITTLNLSDGKDGHRGLIVSGVVPVPKAYNKPVVISTPLVRQGGENSSAEAFVLSDEVMQLIALVEGEATRYVNHERVQTEMFEGKEASENVKAADERMASAAVQSTRPPRGKKPPAAQTETGVPMVNTVGVPLTDENLRQLLLSVERDVPIDAIKKWTSGERDGAQRWAEARQKELVGQLESGTIGVEPKCVIAAATPPLGGDGWTGKAPPRAKDVHPIRTTLQ